MRISASSFHVQQQKNAQHGATKKSSWAEQIKDIKEQQENITQKRAELVAENKEQGGDMDLIKEQLKSYDKQLQGLDEKMQNIMTEQVKEQKEKLGKKEGDTSAGNEMKTEEQLENEKLTRLASLSGRLEHMEQMGSVKDKTQQERSITDAEIKTDNTNRTVLLDRIKLENPEVAKYMDKIGATDSAYENLSELTDRVSTLSESLSGSLGELQGDVVEESKRPDKTEDAEQSNGADSAENMEADKAGEANETPRSETEKALDLTKEFMDQYEQWDKEVQDQQLSGKEAKDYVLDRIAQWTSQLYERGDGSFEEWNRVVNPLDVRA